MINSQLLTHDYSIIIIGLKFWKVGSRKLFAVRDPDKDKRKRKRNSYYDSDEDHILIDKIDIMYAKVSQVLEVNNHLPLPLGLSSIVYETFKCSICLMSPITPPPPAIIGKCCKRIVGCQKCVDEWYKEDRMTKRCPLCQGVRGFADSMILLGIEEFLNSLSSISHLKLMYHLHLAGWNFHLIFPI